MLPAASDEGEEDGHEAEGLRGGRTAGATATGDPRRALSPLSSTSSSDHSAIGLPPAIRILAWDRSRTRRARKCDMSTSLVFL